MKKITFQFAYILQSVPLTLLGVSYSVASFPELVRLYKQKKQMNPTILDLLIPILEVFVV